MTNYREILRLLSLGISNRDIAKSVPCSRNTVASVSERARETGLSWPLLLSEANRDRAESRTWLLCLYSMMPVLCFTIWLVYCYKLNSLNSVVWAYAIEVLTICVALLAFFRMAGFAFGQPNAEKSLRLSMLGAFLCFMSLADNRNTGLQIMLFASALMLTLYAWIMTDNLVQDDAPLPPEKPSDGFEKL